MGAGPERGGGLGSRGQAPAGLAGRRCLVQRAAVRVGRPPRLSAGIRSRRRGGGVERVVRAGRRFGHRDQQGRRDRDRDDAGRAALGRSAGARAGGGYPAGPRGARQRLCGGACPGAGQGRGGTGRRRPAQQLARRGGGLARRGRLPPGDRRVRGRDPGGHGATVTRFSRLRDDRHRCGSRRRPAGLCARAAGVPASFRWLLAEPRLRRGVGRGHAACGVCSRGGGAGRGQAGTAFLVPYRAGGYRGAVHRRGRRACGRGAVHGHHRAAPPRRRAQGLGRRSHRPLDAGRRRGNAGCRPPPWLRGGQQRLRGRIPVRAAARPVARLRPWRLGRLLYQRSLTPGAPTCSPFSRYPFTSSPGARRSA